MYIDTLLLKKFLDRADIQTIMEVSSIFFLTLRGEERCSVQFVVAGLCRSEAQWLRAWTLLMVQ